MGNSIKKILFLFVLFISVSFQISLTQIHIPHSDSLNATHTQGVSKSLSADLDYGKIPLHFIPNEGQVDGRVAYYVQGRDKTIYFTPQGLTFVLNALSDEGDRLHGPRPELGELPYRGSSERWVVKLDFVGSNPEAMPVGVEETGAVISYFKGKPEEWKTGLPAYSKIVYEDLWPGVDLLYHGTFDRMKYEFIVHPGADPSQIRLAYRGTESVGLTGEGRLTVETPVGGFEDEVPVAWQMKDGLQAEVAVAYVLETFTEETPPDHSSLSGEAQAEEEDGQGNRVHVYGFEVGEYDRTLPLVLDPAVLIYCGYIGGSGNDRGWGIAVDASGNAYVTGTTSSNQTTFPVLSGPYVALHGGFDAFVAKVNPSGTALLYCGYIGGSDDDAAFAIAVDGSGNAYVTGQTSSNEVTFPVLYGPDLTHNDGTDAFVAKVNPSGTALLYCGYIGGSNMDFAFGIALGGSGNAYVIGQTYSTEATFPVLSGPVLAHKGGPDAFVAKVNPSGTTLLYCGYIGGSSYDYGFGIAVDALGNAYVTGYTQSNDGSFPVLYGPDMSYNGAGDAFVAKVNPSGTTLLYCGYIGGLSYDRGLGIAVDGSGNAYVTGYTQSLETSFPVLSGPDLTHNDGSDAFAAKVNPSGTALLYCGYIGGSGDDICEGMALDGSGNVYITGETHSTEASFPVLSGPDLTHNGGADAFVAKVNPSGTALLYCGYIGGSDDDVGHAIMVDGSGNAYITGETHSTQTTFPVLSGPDLIFNGYNDAFLAKIPPQTSMPFIFDGHDFDGNGTSDASVFRPSNGRWYIKGVGSSVWGTAGDIPVNGDYNGDGKTDVAVWRPSNGWWYLRGIGGVTWGTSGDIPVPGNYDGDFSGTTDVAVWRPSNGHWYVKGIGGSVWGTAGDIPVPGDYNGDGKTEIAVWRPSSGKWYIKGIAGAVWGMIGDIPVPADYNGDGVTDIAVWRSLNGRWYIKGMAGSVWGTAGDTPAPGDYNGDGITDIAVWRPSNGRWYIKGIGGYLWGMLGDIPLVR